MEEEEEDSPPGDTASPGQSPDRAYNPNDYDFNSYPGEGRGGYRPLHVGALGHRLRSQVRGLTNHRRVVVPSQEVPEAGPGDGATSSGESGSEPTSSRTRSLDDSSDSDLDGEGSPITGIAPRGSLLGSRDDRRCLADIIRRFKRDDLSDPDDPVEAAVWTQVHQLSKFSEAGHILFSCGLWLIFRPHEDQGALVLTRKGRVIYYGKSHTAQPGAVDQYVTQVLHSLAILLVFVVIALSVTHRVQSVRVMLAESLWAVYAFLAAAVALIVCMVWTNRPRRDCGAAFRQHFEIADMCAAIYSRVDSGRQFRTACAKRRRGHLRLAFGRICPPKEELELGLPPGTPSLSCVKPVAQLPAAMAGELSIVEKEKAEKSKHSSGFGPVTTALLACLGIVGASYEYTEFVRRSYEGYRVCSLKVQGCSWKVDNSIWVGQHRVVPGALPPWNYANENCTSKGEFCNSYWRPSDHCVPDPDHVDIVRVRLACDQLEHLWQGMRLDYYTDAYGREHVRYVVTQDWAVDTLPTGHSHPGGIVSIAQGMSIRMLGSSTSKETEKLKDDMRFADDEKEHLLNMCSRAVAGCLDIAFHHMPMEEPLFEEDCEALQESCLAETLGPTTNSWWPPSRFWNHKYEGQRTVCVYRSLPATMTTLSGRVWRVLENEPLKGLLCHGEPQAIHYFRGEHVMPCQAACERQPGCNFAFFGPNDTSVGEHRESTAGIGSRQGRAALEESAAAVAEPAAEEATGLLHRCVLYADCPQRSEAKPSVKDEVFDEVPCGPVTCGGSSHMPCAAIASGLLFSPPAGPNAGRERCEADCKNFSDPRVQCNAYAYRPADGSCRIYGPGLLQTLATMGWNDIGSGESPSLGGGPLAPTIGPLPGIVALPGVAVPSSGPEVCYLRRWPLPANRRFAGGPGLLLQWSSSYLCTGCTPRAVAEYIFNPSNFSNFLANVVTLAGVLYIAKKAHDKAQANRVVFSGKPMVNVVIVQDVANPFGFEEREAAYIHFLSKCAEVADRMKPANVLLRQKANTEELKSMQDDSADVVEAATFDDYELTNAMRTRCFLDRRLLSLFDCEEPVGSWSETQRHSILPPLGLAVLYVALVYVVYQVIPEFGKLLPRTSFMVCVIIPAAFLLHEYMEIRREVQGLCVVTSAGRIVQLSRQPPSSLGFLCPGLAGGTSVRLDVFPAGRLAHLQLDMVALPLWRDRVRAMCTKAWRRGVVSLRGEHGYLEVERTCGEAKHVYQILSALMDVKRTDGLRTVTWGTLDLAGLKPSRDLLTPQEQHIWECRLDEYGFVGDPFNYASILTITDRRILVSRLRHPKPLSLRGLILGPRTCGLSVCCTWWTELMGHHACISVTSVGHNNLQSYATMRTQMPPFWPGFLSPVQAVGVVFLTRFMAEYPASLTVAQRPYGVPRQVLVRHQVRLSATEHGPLKIVASEQPGAVRGGMVVEVWDADGDEVPLDDYRWEAPGGFQLDLGCKIVLEACDPEWPGSADEPWLRQLRHLLDYILGRAEVPEEVWEDMTAPPPPPDGACAARLFEPIFGKEMLGGRPALAQASILADFGFKGGGEYEAMGD